MKRREMLKSVLAAQLFSTAAASQDRKGVRIWPPPAKRTDGGQMPNILWICSDQQRFDTIEGLNNPYIHTPNLRRLAEQSVTFTHAFVQNPVCSPSRASFLTGRYPRTTGLRALGQRIRATERTVPRILADYGYGCALIGKLHLAPVLGGRAEPDERIDDGYDEFHWSHDPWIKWPGRNQYHLWLDSLGIKLPYGPSEPPVWPCPIEPQYTHTAWCANTAINYIRREARFRPWLVSVNMFQPHHPFWPTQEFFDQYDPEKLPSPPYHEGELKTKSAYAQDDHVGNRNLSFPKYDDLMHRKITAAYYAMITEVDYHVGRILKALEETGQAENTVVIYQTDHGELLGDHGLYLKGPYFYEGAIRIPLLVRWPERYKAGLKCDALVEMVDVAPTLLEACGVPVPPSVQGRSLTKLLTGETTSHRDSVYCEYYDSQRLYDPPPLATMVRTQTQKLIVYHSLHSYELYDLEKDPGEVNNIWDDPRASEIREGIMKVMIDRMADTVDPAPVRKIDA